MAPFPSLVSDKKIEETFLLLFEIFAEESSFQWSLAVLAIRRRSTLRQLPTQFREERQHKHKLVGPNFLPDAQGSKKLLPTTRAAGQTHFLVRTCTMFGADVHDPKGSRKTLSRRSLR